MILQPPFDNNVFSLIEYYNKFFGFFSLFSIIIKTYLYTLDKLYVVTTLA